MKWMICTAILLCAGPALAAQTCTEQVGEQKAQILVDRCLQVSAATHPPCNTENPCAMMVNEIKRNCAELTGSDAPGFCKDYAGDDAGQ